VHNAGLTRALLRTSRAVHLVFATLGVGLPLMIALAEILALRRRDVLYRLLARRWAAFFAVLLGARVASGPILAVQRPMLWPAFMRLAGQSIALPFAREVFAFIEAACTAVHRYARDRIRWGLRILSALLVTVGAGASALLIADVNAFMNAPTGFRLQAGQRADIHPWRAMLSPALPNEPSHVLVTVYLALAFALGAFCAVAWPRGAPGREAAYRTARAGAPPWPPRSPAMPRASAWPRSSRSSARARRACSRPPRPRR